MVAITSSARFQLSLFQNGTEKHLQITYISHQILYYIATHNRMILNAPSSYVPVPLSLSFSVWHLLNFYLFPQFVVWHKYIVSGSSSFGFSLNFILSSALQLHLEIFVEIEEEN